MDCESLTPTRGATPHSVDCDSLTSNRGATQQSVDCESLTPTRGANLTLTKKKSGSLRTALQRGTKSEVANPAFSWAEKRAEVLRHPCILGGPQLQARGKNQKWHTGGHIAYMHAFSVKLVIVSLRLGRVIFLFLRQTRAGKIRHIVQFFFVVSRVIFFAVSRVISSAVNACTKKSSSRVIFFCGNACDELQYTQFRPSQKCSAIWPQAFHFPKGRKESASSAAHDAGENACATCRQ